MLVVFGFALYLTLFGIHPLKSRPLPLKDTLGPGPGFFPMWLSILGLALGALLLVEVRRQPADTGEPLMPDRAALMRILAVLGLLALAALALDPLGFRLTALAFTFLLLLALGIRSPAIIAVFVLAASFGVFHVFYYWLKVPLPIGQFGI